MFLPMSCTSPLTVAMRILPWARLAPPDLLFRLHEGQQPGDGFFHDARAFDHLRQKHFARAEQIAHDAHAGHQRAFDDGQRPADFQARFLGVGLDVIDDALDQRVFEPLLDRAFAPFVLDDFGLVLLV